MSSYTQNMYTYIYTVEFDQYTHKKTNNDSTKSEISHRNVELQNSPLMLFEEIYGYF
jgi:hypothetical protein